VHAAHAAGDLDAQLVRPYDLFCFIVIRVAELLVRMGVDVRAADPLVTEQLLRASTTRVWKSRYRASTPDHEITGASSPDSLLTSRIADTNSRSMNSTWPKYRPKERTISRFGG
jgi:hypothetical protein